MSKVPMDKDAAARIQAAAARNNQPSGPGSWPAKAQAAAAKNENAGVGGVNKGK